ncbi:ATP-binding protein [Actinoplanes sp. TBRC 11911]|uniref:AAA family ATPase n=1 Tax=Actinoplanes sp. TBRC 11911 TaxID=2729386 RepID=UPI00145CDB55|nr:AAA family ATPase [Actinoplanes sp. TBRC 11911]NMO53419.1 ATP-binding protein [Actinoplanes sp. TBRC 11911]
MAVPAETPFDVTAIAVRKYEQFTELDGVGKDAAAIVELLCQLGGVASAQPASETRDKASVERQLNEWWGRRERPSSILLWLGHGQANAAGAALACYDTRNPITVNGLLSQTMAAHLKYDWNRREATDDAWAVVIVEACGSGIFINQVASEVMSTMPRRLWLIGVSGTAASYVGRLRTALETAIGRLTTNQEIVPLSGLVEELDQLLVDFEFLPHNPRRVELRYRPPLQAAICAPLDIYAQLVEFLATTPADERNHFFPKAQAAEQGEFGSFFVGRRDERTAICAWLQSAEHGMLVVTGRPGSGKSSMLGNLLLRSNPRWRAVLDHAHLTEPDPEPLTPPDDIFDAAVHLALLDTGQVVRRLAESLGESLPDHDQGWSESDVDALVERLARRRFTVLVDGLDEAIDAVAVASTVLRRLAELPNGRLVIGTRPSSEDAVDEAPKPVTDLLDALAGPPSTILELRRDPDAIGHYMRRRLAAAQATSRFPVSDADIERLSSLVRNLGADKDFLFARLVVHEVMARPTLLREAALVDLIAGDHRSVFRAAVNRLASSMPAAVPLLTALALARGRGMPRSERIWATAARGLNGGEPILDADIDRLLERAAPYILVDAESGFAVYRLAHQTYKTIFSSER